MHWELVVKYYFLGTLIAVRITKLAITKQCICLTGFVSALTLNLLSNFVCLFLGIFQPSGFILGRFLLL